MSSKIYLKCPFEEKDQCKSLGGIWDANKKLWYIELNENVVHFRKWLPQGLDTDFHRITGVALSNTKVWKMISEQIENLNLYPIDLQRIVQNCAEQVEFGQCFQISTAADNEKYAMRFLNIFKDKHSKNEQFAINWLHKEILEMAKRRYKNYFIKS